MLEGARILTAEALAAEPRWDPARVLALPGRCRGVLLRGWSRLVTRRWGAASVGRVRARLGDAGRELPDTPGRLAWLPVGLQVRVADVIIEELLGGDALGMEAALREDSLAASDGMLTRLARTMGPEGLVRRGTEWQAHLYDVGRVSVETRRGEALARFTGTPLYDNPTWRLLQLFTQRMVVDKTGRPVVALHGAELPDGAYAVYMAWRDR